VVELRPDIETDSPLSLQRRVAERMLLSALRERDLAEDAEVRRERADFLAAASTRLGSSLDEEVTLHAVASSALPHPGGWCIVDLLNNAGTMQRLAIVHPDPAKQALACELEGRWLPGSDDPFGVPAMLRSARPTIIDHDVDQALAAVTPDRGVRRTLGELGIAALLTVPLLVGDRLRGAITFVSAQPDHVYTTRDVELAEALAQRSATAIEAARQHAEAVRQRAMAESESRAKSAYIGTISHELRTPLNAIGGYVDLIDLGVRGPVTELQHADLARIRLSQRHLLALITDVLNLVRVTEGATNYHVTEIVACDALTLVSEMLEPLLREKSIAFEGVSCDPALVVRADPEKLTQVLVNLVGNAIKFTPPGGRLAISADATPDFVNVRIADTGIGIPADALSRIFEPFAQVNGTLAGKDSGVGLGLSISRVLARGMGGDLTATSALGAGATFTLSLPRAR
jgi:signal transduction histidine kinase